MYERSKARIAIVEEERTRLEAETKDLERTISRSMHLISTHTNTSVQRQVSGCFLFEFHVLSSFTLCNILVIHVILLIMIIICALYLVKTSLSTLKIDH